MKMVKTKSMQFAVRHLLDTKWDGSGQKVLGLKRKRYRFLYSARSAEEIAKIFKQELSDVSTRIAGKRYAVYLDIIKKTKHKPEILPSGTWFIYEIELKAK